MPTVDLRDLHSGIQKCPVSFRWDDIGRDEKLEFYSGIVSMHQHRDGALEVRSGWAVISKGWVEKV
jgi:hypothetical protein